MAVDRKALIEATLLDPTPRRASDMLRRDLLGGRDAGPRLEAERRAVARLLIGAQPPASASAEIIAAPAAGPRVVDPQWETAQTPSGPRPRRSTRDGFHPVRGVTGLARMQDQASRRDPDAPPLFTRAQINAAEDFANLTHHVETLGVKCSSLEAMTGSGGGDGGWIDAALDDLARMRRMLVAVGDEVILSPIRAGHADRPRRTIRCLVMVRAICCGGLTMAELLRGHGWSIKADYRETCRAALCAALDRLYGL